ncbi:transposon protein, mutator sub-class [Tanacetum coccineum]
MCVVPDGYTYPKFPRVSLSYQASACSLSTLHFLKFPKNSFEVLNLLENSVEVLKILENKLESMKFLENKLESMKILENKLESLKLQENQPVDGLDPENPFGWQDRGRLHTARRPGTPRVKVHPDKSGPVPIRSWSFALPSGRQICRKAGVMTKIGTQFDLRPHMESNRWIQIYAVIQQHLQKIYNGKKAALKERYWVPEEDEIYDVERIRRERPSHISEIQSSATREYPSLIHTFFLTHTIGDVFLNPEDKALYGLGSNTPSGVPYTEDEIMAIVRGGSSEGTFPVSDDKFSQMLTQLDSQREYGGGSGSGGCGDNEPGDNKDGGEDGEDEDDTEEYDLEDDCEAELDEITETLDPHRDIEVVVEKALEQHGDGEENNHHDGKETYLDNFDVDSLDEEILEDGTVELRITQVRFPRALLKYVVQEKRDYIFKKNARCRFRVKCIDEHCEWMVYATNEVHDSKKYFLVKTLNERHTCSKVFQISHVKSPWIAEHYEAMIYAHPGIKPTYILDTIKAQMEIEVTRNQCKRAKALVMKRLERDVLNEYKKLNDYAKALVDTNPRTSIDVEVKHIGTGIPPYLKEDGVVKGMLLTAIEHLKVDIKNKDGGEWTFMSDKRKGLLNAVQAIFPQAEHRLCARHIYANWYLDFHGEQMKLAFYSVAKCANEAQLRQRLDKIDNIQTAIRSRSKNPFDYLDQCYSKEKFIAAYNHPIKVVGSEEFWPNSGRGELSPPLPKPMPGRPKKARRRRKYEPKKSKTKLSRHGRDMHCGNCDSNTHNSKMCSLYDGASTSHDASVPRNRTGYKRKKRAKTTA